MTDTSPSATTAAPGHRIDSIEALEALYGAPAPASLLKVLDHVSEDYGRFVAAAPFMILASVGPDGVDCSPRGDPAGFVHIGEDRRTLFIPDRRGNNRIDSLRNIVRDPRVHLLFMIPGIGETLRVKGRASISADPALCDRFTIGDRRPTTVIVVRVEAVFTQCQKALVRSKLWDPATQIPRAALPSVGQMLQRISEGSFDGQAYDDAYPERMARTIY